MNYKILLTVSFLFGILSFFPDKNDTKDNQRLISAMEAIASLSFFGLSCASPSDKKK